MANVFINPAGSADGNSVYWLTFPTARNLSEMDVSTSLNQYSATRVIILAGVVAGTLDILAACMVYWLRAGVTPMRVLQSVAAGVFGAASFGGGTKTAVLGLILHFIIATTAAAVYYVASRRLNFLIDQPIIAGLLYGVVVYLFMNLVVLPLSNVAKRPVPLSGRIIGLVIIILFVGLPIAAIVRKYSKPRTG